MIRWNKNISVKRNSNDDVYITTDRGQRWDSFAIDSRSRTPITDWWEQNHHSNLREWQKDAVIKGLSDVFGSGTYYVLYQKSKGTHQPHDICLAQWSDTWVLSTERDLWLWRTNYAEYNLDINTSFGSILEQSVREEWYKVLDGLKSYQFS